MNNTEALTIFRTIQKCRHQALHTNDCGNCERCQYRLEQEQIDGAVALAISALEKQEADRWIPITEKLPEPYKTVIVTDIETIDTYTSEYHGGGYWNTDTGDAKGRIIAWRPLPEPYPEPYTEE